jgi:hypothetical protein
MPYADWGEKISFNSSQFLKLKSKNDKVHFRILGRPYYDGKHFFQLQDGTWDIQPCSRVNEGVKCPHCDTYFSIIMKAKKTGDKTIIEQAKKEAKPFQNSVSAYFPIINRENEEFAIFQTTMGVRDEIEAEVSAGTKALDTDFVVIRTEVPGKYYRLSKVDSADTKALTDKEKQVVEQYKTVNLEDMVSGKASDNETIAVEDDVVNF